MTTVWSFKRLVVCAAAIALVGTPALADPMPGMVMPATTGSGTTNEFGKTNNFDEGHLTQDTYSHTWYCDTSVTAHSATGCEAGATFKRPPSSAAYDPLYITVPLGFAVPEIKMQCPQGLVCVDHPPTVDLSAIGGPTNAMTPGHDHFTTTTNNFQPEWWDVIVIGVKNRQTYDEIAAHRSYAYIAQLIASHNPYVTPEIPTNIFLYFAVRPVGYGN